jgi:hypothetical protein
MTPWIEQELARHRRRELEAEADAYRRASSLQPAATPGGSASVLPSFAPDSGSLARPLRPDSPCTLPRELPGCAIMGRGSEGCAACALPSSTTI